MRSKIKKCLALVLTVVTLCSLTIVNADVKNPATADEALGNFRNARAGSIGANCLYRSQHPVNGSYRSRFALKLMQENNIRTVLDLSDSDSSLKKYFKKNNIGASNYYRMLYNSGSVYTAHMSGGSRKGSSTRKKVAKVGRFMAKKKGPYLIHCELGRDRTGFVMLVLESLMGAPYSYMLDDFTFTDMNRKGDTYEKSKKTAISRLNSDLSIMTGKSKKTNWSKQDLAKYAEKYLKKGGMTKSEIAALKRNLTVSYPKASYTGSTAPAKTVTAPVTTTPKTTTGTAPAATATPADSTKSTAGTAPAAPATPADSTKSTTGKAPSTNTKTPSTPAATAPETTAPAASTRTTATPAAAKKTTSKESPAYRNLSINGKTILSKTIKVGQTYTFNYKLEQGDLKNYAVECYNSNKSKVKVKACGKGKLTIKGRKKGTVVLRLRNKKDHNKRVKITITVKK